MRYFTNGSKKKIAIRSILDSTYFSGYYLRKKIPCHCASKSLFSNFDFQFFLHQSLSIFITQTNSDKSFQFLKKSKYLTILHLVTQIYEFFFFIFQVKYVPESKRRNKIVSLSADKLIMWESPALSSKKDGFNVGKKY